MANISFVELKYNTIPIGDMPAGKLLHDGPTPCDMHVKNLQGAGGRGWGGGRGWEGEGELRRGESEGTQMGMKRCVCVVEA